MKCILDFDFFFFQLRFINEYLSRYIDSSVEEKETEDQRKTQLKKKRSGIKYENERERDRGSV